ncbi:MAG TPA: hypothetical protein VF962_07735, partial [Gemmatimonadaceae bacterium]
MSSSGEFPAFRFVSREITGSASRALAQACALPLEPLIEFGSIRYVKTGKQVAAILLQRFDDFARGERIFEFDDIRAQRV